MAIADGEREIGLICLDLIDVPKWVIAEAKAQILERTGVSGDMVLISCTHTHTGPSAAEALGTPAEPEYTKTLPTKIADAWVMAHNHKVPAELHAPGGAARKSTTAV